jgi:ribonuclease P protein component
MSQSLSVFDKIRSTREISLFFQKSDGKLTRSVYTIYWRKNDSRPRLAVCLSRVKLATDRNHLKRLVRETWRTAQVRPAIDIVIVVKSQALTDALFTAQLLKDLDSLAVKFSHSHV